MINFKYFANVGTDDEIAKDNISIRHRQIRDNRIGSRMEKVLKTDFEKCKCREDFEKYISRYGRYKSNTYVSLAQAKIESIDARKNENKEREKKITPPPKKRNILQMCIKVAIWFLILGGCRLGVYYLTKPKINKNTTDVITLPKQKDLDEERADYSSHTHSEQNYEQENTIDDSNSESSKILLMPCSICDYTGICKICSGLGRCSVCGGGGSVWSYEAGSPIDCTVCEGTGRCNSCDGSGECFACHGRGEQEVQL